MNTKAPAGHRGQSPLVPFDLATRNIMDTRFYMLDISWPQQSAYGMHGQRYYVKDEPVDLALEHDSICVHHLHDGIDLKSQLSNRPYTATLADSAPRGGQGTREESPHPTNAEHAEKFHSKIAVQEAEKQVSTVVYAP